MSRATVTDRDRRAASVAAVAEQADWQGALAGFGCFALRSGELQSVLGRVVDLAAHHLASPVSVVSRLTGPGRARIEGMHGWFGVPIGHETPFPAQLQAREWAEAT